MKLFWSLRPPYTVELMLIVIFMLALLIVGALADPVIPDDKTKTEALKLGYVLNGNSMPRRSTRNLFPGVAGARRADVHDDQDEDQSDQCSDKSTHSRVPPGTSGPRRTARRYFHGLRLRLAGIAISLTVTLTSTSSGAEMSTCPCRVARDGDGLILPDVARIDRERKWIRSVEGWV